jgi:leucyl-tRNA synthetase
MRDRVIVKLNETKEVVLKIAKDSEKIKTWLAGKKIEREIYVEGKMVNLVVKE